MKSRQQRTDETRAEYLTALRRYAARKYRQLRAENTDSRHASFLVRDALLVAEKYFVDSGTFGVESVTEVNGEGTNVVELCYLNAGDTYELTVCYDWNRQSFIVASYGDVVEAAERSSAK